MQSLALVLRRRKPLPLPSVRFCEFRKKDFHEGVPGNFSNAEGKACLIILDDLINNAYSKDVCHLFKKGSYRNISVILITQNLIHQGHNWWDTSLNAEHLVLLMNVRVKNQFSHLAPQVYVEDSGSLYEAYLDAIKQPHGYILSDVSQNTDDLPQFQNNIFPTEYPPVKNALVSDEMDKVQLSRATCA